MVQTAAMKILLYLSGGVHWMGGVQYTRNIIRAFALLPEHEKATIVLHIGEKNKQQGFEQEFSSYSNIILDAPKPGVGAIESKIRTFIRRVQCKLFGWNMRQNILLSDACSVAFPVKGPRHPGSAKKVYWIPDFQYKHLPDFFSPQECSERDLMYQRMLQEKGFLVLSSEAAKNDFTRFFPQYANKPVRILNFCTTLEEADYLPDPISICQQYNLPSKYVYLPSQMWQHKGFDTVWEALALLKKRGVEIPLVCTGSQTDYRSKNYFSHLENKKQELGIAQQIHMLGLISRADQIQIFRRAALILQPSYFEGWSTIVEDARALGKSILLSDIAVHQEQNPAYATYFKVGDALDLAEKLFSQWDKMSPGPDIESELHAREAARLRSMSFARAFQKIMQEAHLS